MLPCRSKQSVKNFKGQRLFALKDYDIFVEIIIKNAQLKIKFTIHAQRGGYRGYKFVKNSFFGQNTFSHFKSNLSEKMLIYSKKSSFFNKQF